MPDQIHRERDHDVALHRSARADDCGTAKIPLLMDRPYKEAGISFAIESYGVRIGIHLRDASIIERVLLYLPPYWLPVQWDGVVRSYRIERAMEESRPEDVSSYILFEDETQVRWPTSAEQVLIALESRVEHFLAERAYPYLFVHAGVVGWEDSALVIPGRSLAGKSSLVAALVARGATYFSDEFAVLDFEGNAYPYPRRLSLRDGRIGLPRRLDLGIHVHREPLPAGVPVSRIALLSYLPGRTLEIHEVSQATAMLALCEHVAAIRRRPNESLDILRHLTSNAKVLQGVRGEADSAAQRLLGLAKCTLPSV